MLRRWIIALVLVVIALGGAACTNPSGGAGASAGPSAAPTKDLGPGY